MNIPSHFPDVPSNPAFPSVPSHKADVRSTSELQQEYARLSELDHKMLFALYKIMIQRMHRPEDRKAVDDINTKFIELRKGMNMINNELLRRQRGGTKKRRSTKKRRHTKRRIQQR